MAQDFTLWGIGKSNGLFHRLRPPTPCHPMPPCPLMPALGVGPHAPRQRLASAGCRRRAAGSHRSARTGRVAGDGQPARLELLGGRLLGVMSESPAYIGGRLDRGAPCYGEDNYYVYGELLGMSSQEIEALAEEGVI
jgi:hypothetical protein